MSVLSKLASALDRRDEIPNQELAVEIISKNDKAAVKELVANIGNKDKNIQSDCIKVLYEIGEQEPSLIADYDKEFLALLDSKNNRLIWGAMTALDGIASVNPKAIYNNISKILDASDKGSVITKDHAISVLIKLSSDKNYSENTLVLLIDQLKSCATNQLPMYAENSAAVIPEKLKATFISVLSSRIPEIEKESKQKRIEKVIRKIQKAK